MDGRMNSSAHVAVVGTGPAGLAAIKSLLEEGFQVTGFERRSTVGGLWSFTEDPEITSATPQTRLQFSKFMAPMTDFPVPPDFPRFPNAAHLSEYYQQYARHFGLLNKINFDTTVTSISRSIVDDAWMLAIEGRPEPLAFDKVIVAAGSECTPIMPTIEGIEKFQGRLMHSREYKHASSFHDLTVVVLGQGNSAGDAAVELLPHARKVYLAHRRGELIIPRLTQGKRTDAFSSFRLQRITYFLQRYLPSLHRLVMAARFGALVRLAWGTPGPTNRLEHYDLDSAAALANVLVSDDIVPLTRSGALETTHGIRRVVGSRSLEMDDGRVLHDVDVIIACTGYHSSMDIFAPGVVDYVDDPSTPHRIPRLYRQVSPPAWADSLACLNSLTISEHAAVFRELAGMAVVQTWAGKSPLPPRDALEAQADAQVRYYTRRCAGSKVTLHEGVFDPYEWTTWVHQTAGTGVVDGLGWSWEGVKFFLREPRLCLLMGWGVYSPHVYRFFETGKRKAWAGAREAILRVNRESAEDLEMLAREAKEEKMD